MTLATVESCTAGLLAHMLSEGEAASDILHGGFIVYTKENKTAAAGVPKALPRLIGELDAGAARRLHYHAQDALLAVGFEPA